MKDSFNDRFEAENAGNTRSFSVKLPVHVADWVNQAALKKGKSAEQFLVELIIEAVGEEALPVEVHLHRIDELVKKIEVMVKKTPKQEEKDAKTHIHSLEARTKRREHLIELGMEAYDELRKIAASEQASGESQARIQAFAVMARIGTFNAAVIRDAENDEIENLLEELEETDTRLKQKLKKLEEQEAEERERYQHR